MAKPKRTFISGPATATRIFERGGAGGTFSPAELLSPSNASEVIICGNFTKPPAGIQRQEYSMPSRVQLKILGPKPMANASTFKPDRRAKQQHNRNNHIGRVEYLAHG